MARYERGFKDRAVARLLPRKRAPLDAVAREVGVSASNLERWPADALAQPVQQRSWTAAVRPVAVITTAALDEAARNAWYPEQAVYPQELAQWRISVTQALPATPEARASPQQTEDLYSRKTEGFEVHDSDDTLNAAHVLTRAAPPLQRSGDREMSVSCSTRNGAEPTPICQIR